MVHQISCFPAISLSEYTNISIFFIFHMRRKSSFKPWFISVECIPVLADEVKKILGPRTLFNSRKKKSIVAMKAVRILQMLTSEGSTFHLLICWIIFIITQYISHLHFNCYHRSCSNYFYRLKFYFTIIVSIINCIFLLFWFKRSNVSGVVTLLVDSQPLSVFCHMGSFGCGDGGWTPVMKIDGREMHTYN